MPESRFSRPPAHYFVPFPVSIPWTLRVEQPVVVSAQIRTTYRGLEQTDGRIAPNPTPDYIARLHSVIEFARLQKANFCVFPEYCWPLVEIRPLLADLRAHFADEMVFIIPIEHITVGDYRDLLRDFKTKHWIHNEVLKNELAELAEKAKSQNDTVNVALTVFQSTLTRRRLTIVPQRKLAPAALEGLGERSWRFVFGRTVYVIGATVHASEAAPHALHFATLVCFDFINRGYAKPERPRDVLAHVELNYLFVPECNPAPLHESYFKGSIALFQAPLWAQNHPVIFFTNIAAGSELELPATIKPYWGFSRVVGNLGRFDDSGGSIFVDGYVGYEAASPLEVPSALEDLSGKNAARLKDKRVRTAIIRPEAAVACITMPNIKSGPSEDPTQGRWDTRVDVYRAVGTDVRHWRRVSMPQRGDSPQVLGIPERLRGLSLEDPGDLQKELRDRIRKKVEPIYVEGSPGVGKSALVAAALEEHIEDDRIVWIDLSDVRADEESLIEALLQRMGRRAVLGLSLGEKLGALHRELRRNATIIVLDAVEEWNDVPLPVSVLALHGWKTRVIVIYKRGEGEGRSPDLQVSPLPDDAFARVLQRHSGCEVPDAFVAALSEATEHAALGAVWGGELIRNAPESLPSLLQELTTPSASGEKATLQTIFRWCLAHLVDDLSKSILGILCEVPGVLPASDFAGAFGMEESEESAIITRLQDLQRLRLLEAFRGADGSDRARVHPFVRHVWRKAPVPYLDLGWTEAFWSWASWAADTFGGDYNFNGVPAMRARWTSLAHVLYRLSREDTREARRAFLDIWRNCDYFLWIDGRWRERIELARLAERYACDVDADEPKDVQVAKKRYRIHALYDSLAKTIWHMSGARSPADAYLADARKLAKGFDATLEAHVVWYQSRLVRHCDKVPQAALAAAEEAIQIARQSDQYTKALLRNARGNAFRDFGNHHAARQNYNEALERLRRYGESPETRELRAVIQRNLGRLDFLAGHPEMALAQFEDAKNEFRHLHNLVQEAECAIFHAEALITVGDFDDSKRELDWAEGLVAHFGAKLLQDHVKRVRDRLNVALRPRA